MSADRFEVTRPEFKRLVLGNAPLETLGSGFGWLEGPVWFADQQCLYVSDLPSDRVLRWSENGGVSVAFAPSGFANGHARDRQGRLLTCSHRHRNVTRIEPDGTVTVLADSYGGRRLNAPNDIVCQADGTIWFTDPIYGISTDYEGGKQEPELPPTVYQLRPDGSLIAAITGLPGPNGLAFSPDERWLYVSDSGHQFDDDAPRRLLRYPAGRFDDAVAFATVSPGYADGFRVDEDGRIWTGAGDGVHCFSPEGELLGKILTGCTVANLCFGGRNRSRLFICASHALMAIYTNVRGCVRP